MSIWDDLTQKVEKADRAVFDQYPDVRKSVEELETRFTVADTKLKEWEKFDLATKWNKEAAMPQAAKDRIDALEAQVSGFESRGETDMTWEEMQGKVKETVKAALTESGGITKDNLEKDFLPKVATKDDLAAFDRGVSTAYGKTMHMPVKYFKEFGNDDFTVEALFNHMKETGITDYDKAYNSFVAPKRAEFETKKHQEEIAAAKKEGAEEALKNRDMNRESMPADQRGASPEGMGWYQKMKFGKLKPAGENAPPPLPEGKLGDGTASQAAYDAYMEKQRSAMVH